MTDPAAILVLCTAPDEDVATRLARGLVNERLAACVNLLPGVRSFYRWKGEVHEDPEVQLLIKTRASRLEALEVYLEREHPYEVPEIVAVPLARVEAKYLKWMVEQTE